MSEAGVPEANLETIMSEPRSRIPENNKILLAAKAAGRCEFRGCNKYLYEEMLTKKPGQFSNFAHIIPYKENGPRGEESKGARPEDINSVDNLMLLCRDHHKLIDANPGLYTVQKLLDIKKEHEDRISLTTSIQPECRLFVVNYAVHIKNGSTAVSPNEARIALLPRYYPAQRDVIDLSPQLPERTHDSAWYKMAVDDLRSRYNEFIKRRIRDDASAGFAVFAIAPMPLLIQLGVFLNDTTNSIVFQKQRDSGWRWDENAPDRSFSVTRPTETRGKSPVLLLSLTDRIDTSLVKQALGEDVAIWELSSNYHGYDVISKREHLVAFKCEARRILDDVLKDYPDGKPVHVFPIMPVSACVEFGRLRVAAHNPWMIYERGGNARTFTKTILID